MHACVRLIVKLCVSVSAVCTDTHRRWHVITGASGVMEYGVHNGVVPDFQQEGRGRQSESSDNSHTSIKQGISAQLGSSPQSADACQSGGNRRERRSRRFSNSAQSGCSPAQGPSEQCSRGRQISQLTQRCQADPGHPSCASRSTWLQSTLGKASRKVPS